MKKIITTFHILLLAISILYGNSKDSLVRFNDIAFHNDFEKQAFSKLCHKKDSSDYLSFLLSVDSSMTEEKRSIIEGKISKLVQELRNKGINDKSDAKKIKIIYASVHDYFFKKYALQNKFSDIFNNGQYNCVSGTALYSLMFEEMSIPYIIKRSPNHVFLMAYPHSSNILLETTNPLKGYFQYNEAFVKNFNESLLKGKLISEQEYTATPANDLFTKYFFSEEDINLRQLIGLQYYNAGLYAAEREENIKALNHFRKAYLLYPSEGIKFLIKNHLLNLVSEADYTTLEDLDYSTALTRFSSKDLEVEVLKDEFVKITQDQLIKKGDWDLYLKSYEKIYPFIKDSILKSEIEFIYHYETLRVGLTTGKNIDEDKKMERLHQLQPKSMYTQSIIADYVVNRIRTMSNVDEIFKHVKGYVSKFPFLEENQNIAMILSNCYLEKASQEYYKNNLSNGDQNLQSFEMLAAKNKKVINENFVERAYSEAFSAYFRKGQSSKAKGLLRKGLEYAPDNFNLKMRLSMIK